MIIIKIMAFFAVSFTSGTLALLGLMQVMKGLGRLRERLGGPLIPSGVGTTFLRKSKAGRQEKRPRGGRLRFDCLGRRPAPGQIDAIKRQTAPSEIL